MRAKRINESKPAGKLFEKKWDVKLHLNDVWAEAEDMDTDSSDGFDQFKSIIMPKLRRFLDKMTIFMEGEDSLDDLETIIQNLDDSTDSMEWDYNWEDFYDWADDNNVWIDVNSSDDDVEPEFFDQEYEDDADEDENY